MAEQDLLEELKGLARRTAREKFQQGHPGFFLMGNAPRESSDAEIGFMTGVHSIEAVRAEHERIMREGPAAMKPGPFLVAVRKKKSNEWMRWVSLGRAPNNDVVLRHSSISKLHARIHLESSSKLTVETQEYWMIDAGSAQGTSVNGRMLSTSNPLRLKSGDRIRFGAIDCQFLDSGMLYDLLRRMPRQSAVDLPAVDIKPPPGRRG